MSKSEAAKVAAKLQGANGSVWDDDPFVRALNLSAELGKVLGDIAASGHAPDENAGRVAELERQLAERGQITELHEQLASRLEQKVREAEELLATAYVAREVPWSDVAAGMMTISKTDGTPWMVESRGYDATDEIVVLTNGGRRFDKRPADGETVRVLVPYVTPETAEAAVREQLGGRA